VVLVGLIRIFGYFTGIEPIKQAGTFTAASPLPLVFAEGPGREFAPEYTVDFFSKDGQYLTLPITSEVFSRLSGPLDRRGAYATAVAFTKFFSDEIWNSIVGYGVCKNGPLARAFNLEEEIAVAIFNLSVKRAGKEDSWARALQCES